jgi:amino acid transporter
MKKPETLATTQDPANRSHRLKPDTIGPWGLAALAIGMTSPAMGMYAIWGPMQVAAGPVTPLIFLATTLMTLPTAISYALLNREAPSAAAATAWVWAGIHPLAGYLAGFLMTTYFFMAAIAVPPMFGLFLHDLLALLHLDLSQNLTLILGVFISTAPIAWVCLRGAEVSIKSTVRLMTIETFVVIALSITILIVKSKVPGAINLAPFNPHHVSSLSGFWIGMVLGILAFCGFDVVSTAAEETHAPREHVPKAIILTVIGIGLFWALNAWIFTLSTPEEQIRQYTTHGLTAVTPIAQAYWGIGTLVVVLTAFTGLTAIYISGTQGASRIIFALARQGLLPAALARLSGENRVPKNAILIVLLSIVVLNFVSLYVLDNGIDIFTWWANALVFFATLTYLAVNVASGFFFWRYARSQFGILKHVLIPAAGALLNGYLIYAAFFLAMWNSNFRTGKSVVIASVALLALQIAAVMCVRIARPGLLRGNQRSW